MDARWSAGEFASYFSYVSPTLRGGCDERDRVEIPLFRAAVSKPNHLFAVEFALRRWRYHDPMVSTQFSDPFGSVFKRTTISVMRFYFAVRVLCFLRQNGTPVHAHAVHEVQHGFAVPASFGCAIRHQQWYFLFVRAFPGQLMYVAAKDSLSVWLISTHEVLAFQLPDQLVPPCLLAPPICLCRALLHSALRRMKESETGLVSTAAVAAPTITLEHERRPESLSSLPPSQGVVSATTNGANGGHWKSSVDDAAAASGVNDGHHSPPFGDVDVVSVGADGHPPPMIAVNGGAGVDARGSSSSSNINSRSQVTGGIEMEDLEAALKGFSAESLRGAGLFRSSVEWGDVGGLNTVRAELREILEVRVHVNEGGALFFPYAYSFVYVWGVLWHSTRRFILYPTKSTRSCGEGCLT